MPSKLFLSIATLVLKIGVQSGQEKSQVDFDVASFYDDYEQQTDTFDWEKVFTTTSTVFIDPSYGPSKVAKVLAIFK